jgi:hypothetical protein
MDLLPPHPAPPSSGGVTATSPPPRTNTLPPPHLPPVPAVAPSVAASAEMAIPSATASTTAAPSGSSTPSAPSAPDDRTTAFHSVDTTADQGLGTTLLVEAYSAIWIIMMGFVLLGWRKQGALNVRLDELEKAIDKSEAAKQKKA